MAKDTAPMLQEDVEKYEKMMGESIDNLGEMLQNMYKNVSEYRDRLRQIDDKKTEESAKDAGDSFKDSIKGALMGAVAGFSIGKVIDQVLPRDQLDALTDTREMYIQMYGDDKEYKKIKDTMYDRVQEMNKILGVSAFGGEDITEGMAQAIKANIDSDLVPAFSLAAAKLKKVGAELGDTTAKTWSNAFGDQAPELMDELANVLSMVSIAPDVKSEVTQAVADAGEVLTMFHDTQEGKARSMREYASALSEMENLDILTIDQAAAIRDLMVSAARGDVSAITNLSKLGVNPQSVMGLVQNGSWGTAFEEVLTGISSLPENVEALNALELDIDNDAVIKIQNHTGAIARLGAQVKETVEGSMVKSIDGLSQAEIRAGEIANQSVADRVSNFITTSDIVKSASSALEKLNIDASTATTVIGTAAGAGKGMIETLLLIGAHGGETVAMLKNFAAMMNLSTLATQIATAAQWLYNAAMYANPIGLVIAAVVALAAGAYLLYKNWDVVMSWFTGSWEYLKDIFFSFTDWLLNSPWYLNPLGPTREAIKFLIAYVKFAFSTWGKVFNWLGKVIGWVTDKVRGVLKVMGLVKDEAEESLELAPEVTGSVEQTVTTKSINEDPKEPASGGVVVSSPSNPSGSTSTSTATTITNTNESKEVNVNLDTKDQAKAQRESNDHLRTLVKETKKGNRQEATALSDLKR